MISQVKIHKYMIRKEKMNFIETIENQMKSKKITAYKMCKDLNIPAQTITNWKKGSKPNIDTAIQVIKYLELSADEIFEIKIKNTNEPRIQEIIEKYKILPKEKKELVLNIVQTLAEDYEFEQNTQSQKQA